MQDKTCVVTGANAGIGFAIAKGLASDGARVILWCRTEDKGVEACRRIRDLTPTAKVSFVASDLASQTDIDLGAQQIVARQSTIDVLVNNAAVWNSERKLTVDGVEEMFAVNHLSYFLLTQKLYPALAKSSGARILCVASDSHRMLKALPKDPQLTGNYHGLRAYAVGKLANILFTYEFNRRKPHEHVTINALKPGLVQTDIGIKHANWFHRFAWRVRRNMRGHQTPEQGAYTPLYVATSPDIQGRSGEYWSRDQAVPTSAASYDEQAAERLWSKSMELCGLDRYFP